VLVFPGVLLISLRNVVISVQLRYFIVRFLFSLFVFFWDMRKVNFI